MKRDYRFQYDEKELAVALAADELAFSSNRGFISNYFDTTCNIFRPPSLSVGKFFKSSRTTHFLGDSSECLPYIREIRHVATNGQAGLSLARSPSFIKG